MTYFYRLITVFGIVCLGSIAAAQQLPGSSFSCVTPSPDLEQVRLLDKAAEFALSVKKAAGNTQNTITYIPIRPHIFRYSDGTGGITMAHLNHTVGMTNRYFLLNGYGVQFYFAGTTPDYIDNDTHYEYFPIITGENAAVNGRDATNALNLYVVKGFEVQDVAGYAHFPENTVQSTRLFVRNLWNARQLGSFVIPHELGHTFNLLHTFEGSTSATPELVTRGSGANCTVAGDLLCDTPADPYGRAGATFYDNYTDCPVYNGTATDPQGQTYTPPLTNLMSYYDPCQPEFSAGQHNRMAAALALRQTHTAYSLTYPPTAVAAPTALSATLSTGGNSVTLTWQDQATNEMGYFIERSTSPSGVFLPIGGTAPNVTVYTDVFDVGNTTYYYRVRPSNTTTGSLSSTIMVVAPICRPTYTVDCSTSNGLSGVAINNQLLSRNTGCSPTGYSSYTQVSAVVLPGVTIPFSVTANTVAPYLDVTVWADFNRNAVFERGEELIPYVGPAGPTQYTATFQVPSSTPPGTLPIRLLSSTTNQSRFDACGQYQGGETEDYVLTVANVTPTCTTPTGLTTIAQTTSSALLSWTTSPQTGTYTIQYTQQGFAPYWQTTIEQVVSPPVTLTGLATGRAYDWRISGTCTTSTVSPYSPITSFSTVCGPPTDLTVPVVFGDKVLFNWTNNALPTPRHTVEWKPATSSSWFTYYRGELTDYARFDLLPNTTYDWRVKAQCEIGSTGYTTAASFTTTAEAHCKPSVYGMGCQFGEGLSSFKINNTILSANSGCSAGAYRFNIINVASLVIGAPQSFTAAMLSNYGRPPVAIWIDLNRNGLFDVTEKMADVLSDNGIASGSFIIPSNTRPGKYVLRLRMRNTDNPCESIDEGEVEDYTVTILYTPTDLSLRLISSRRVAALGEVIPLTLVLDNAGPGSSGPIQLTSRLPATMQYMGSSAVNVHYQNGIVYVAADNVEANTALSYPLNIRIQQPGAYRVAAQLSAAMAPDPDSSPNSGTSDGEDDMATIDLRTREAGGGTYESPNPNPRVLPAVVDNQPPPLPNEADLSLQLIANTLTPTTNAPMTLSAVVANRGALAATNVVVQFTLPTGWTVTNSSGLTVNGQTVTATVSNLPVGQRLMISISVQVSGTGKQTVQAAITGATESDTDSPHTNAFGQGEDDEAEVSVRVR